MKPTFVLLSVVGVAALTVLVEEVSAGPVVCPHCVCPPSYSPVCGYRKSTNSPRDFPSRCVLECTNKCRKIKYDFVYDGRCAKWVSSTAPEAPPTPQAVARTTTTTLPPVPAEPALPEDDPAFLLEPTSE